MNDKNIINEKDLENVSGGFIFDASNIVGANRDYPWEVIANNDGHVIQRFRTEWEAKDFVQRNYGISDPLNEMKIEWNDLVALRNNPRA